MSKVNGISKRLCVVGIVMAVLVSAFTSTPVFASSVTISASSTSIGLGESVLFTSIITIDPPYSPKWFLNSTEGPGAHEGNWTFTPTEEGVYLVYLYVTAEWGGWGTSNVITITVEGTAPSVVISASVTSADAGQSVLFTSSISGVPSPYSLHWFVNSTEVLGTTEGSLTYTPTLGGVCMVSLTVTGEGGGTWQSNVIELTVYAHIFLNANSTSIVLGESVLLTADFSGVPSPYEFWWMVDGEGVYGSGDTPSESWTYIPTATGSHTVYLYAFGGNGWNLQSNVITITVDAPSVVISANSTSMVLGDSVLFTAIIKSSWQFRFWCVNSTTYAQGGSSWTFTPTEEGVYIVYLRVVVDLSGEGGPLPCNFITLTVSAPSSEEPEVPAVAISADSTSIALGDSVLFTANLTLIEHPSLISPRWYVNTTKVYGEWIFEDGNIYTLTYTPTVEGMYIVDLYVTGEGGGAWRSNVITLTVSAEPTTPEGLTIGIMMLLSAVAVIVSTSYFRKRPPTAFCGS
jgi:hypothetical protein